MDTSNWGTPIELSSGSEPAARRFDEPAERSPVARSAYGRRVATVLVLAGFALVVLSQVLPWLTVNGSLGDASDFGTSLSDRQFSTADGASVLLFAYDILWLPVLVLCASCVFARGSRQRMLFAGGAGALASQFSLMLPMLAKPGRVIGQGSLFDTGSLHASLSAGAYFAVAALLAFGGAVVLAVGGRVLPTAADWMPAGGTPAPGAWMPVPATLTPNNWMPADPTAIGGWMPVPGVQMPAPRPMDMHAALATSQPPHEHRADIDYGLPAPASGGTADPYVRPAVDHSFYEPQSNAAPADNGTAVPGDDRPDPGDHSMYDTRPRPATVDHSMYVRPRESEETHG